MTPPPDFVYGSNCEFEVGGVLVGAGEDRRGEDGHQYIELGFLDDGNTRHVSPDEADRIAAALRYSASYARDHKEKDPPDAV